MRQVRSLIYFGCFLLSLSVQALAIGPGGYQGLADDAYARINLAAVQKTGLRPGANFSLVRNTGDQKKSASQFRVTRQTIHANGDVSIHATDPASQSTLVATLGENSLFGTLYENGEHIVLTTEGNGSWAVTLPQQGLVFNSCGLDHDHSRATPMNITPQSGTKALDEVIDVLVIYNQAFADRYPGNLAETRINHFMTIANETLANSVTSVATRLVGTELVDYSNDNGNVEARDDIANALAGTGTPAAGLGTLNFKRNQTGADLVIMVRPHDIELRGNCGVAFFPTGDPSIGVNLVSDAMDSWSVCADDVLVHEIGHNLGAGHQVGAGGAFFDPRGSAFINSGQYTTVMGSFGTGRADRFRGLHMFSNPDVPCGGQPCGSDNPADLADNASVIRDIAPLVAGYRNASSSVPLPEEMDRSTLDSDGDGVIDWDDHFPFDASEQADADLDGTGDNSDAFPSNAVESVDTDGDGLGDLAADSDDDNDGRLDFNDAFPLDPNETTDSDEDGVGDNSDAFPNNRAEFADIDNDGVGNSDDPDDDNDGFDELSTIADDLLVISVGNNRILRFDAVTGESRGVELLPSDGLLTFQSDLAYRDSDHSLIYFSDSSTKRLNLLNREPLGTFVSAFDTTNSVAALGTGFPTGLGVVPKALQSGAPATIHTVSMTQSFVVDVFGEQATRTLTVGWGSPQQEAFKDLIMDGNSVLALGRSTRSLYRGNPAESTLSILSGPGTSWMQSPQRMALTPDNRLFITDAGRNTVVQVNPANGAFLSDFADIGAAGYSSPAGIVVNAEGDLLVAAADQNAILRFDGSSGNFLGELVSTGQGGLSNPQAMTLVPQLIDRYGDDPTRVIRPNGGLWFNPLSNGRGFDIEVFGNILTAIWYAYDEEGNPLWYYSQGALDGFTYSGTLNIITLGDDGAVLNEIGTVRLDFASERQAQLSWTIGQESGGEPLQWLEFSVEPASNDYTGLWGRPDGPGWGISLATQGQSTVAIAFIYDDQGMPRWVISDPVNGASPLNFDMFALFSDTLCPTCSGQSSFSRINAGTMDITVPGSGSWSSDVTYPSPLTGGWQLDNTDLILFSEQPERPR